MSDGPSKIAPKAEPLDEIILGDDEPTIAKPPPPTPSKPPPIRSKPPDRNSAPPYFPAPPPVSQPPKRSSGRVRAAANVGEGDGGDRDSQARKRAKMTLRIPDDEIARPHDEITIPLVRQMTGPPPPHLNADDTLELPSDELRARSAAALSSLTQTDELPVIHQPVPAAVPLPPVAPAAGVDRSHEPGWTPDQPHVIKPSPILDVKGSADPAPSPARFPSSEEIPVAVDLGLANDGDGSHASDSEEIKIEHEPPQRLSATETGEVEIDPGDLMAVDSVHPAADVKTAGKYPAYRSEVPQQVAPPTASALIAVSHTNPPASPSQPPPVVIPPPAIAAPVVTGPQQRAETPMAARRQSTPALAAAGAGQLAPPPMTDSAAGRKKTKPWWEELFNDDFIRTMAKVTDAQIGAEVTFIEESLGCEAGAMILDLACGTGRHAVELAARKYQVVGFDLSLAMLARASDEAQDRKQKINFVQGDMREMTFEETFDGVYSWNTSFGYFDEQQNSNVIAKVHKSLKKGGQFLLDVVNRDYIVRQAPSLAWFEGDGCICMDEMQIDFITSRMKVKRTLMMDDGRTKEIEYSIRVYSLHELGKMLHDNGFRVAEVSGRTATPGVFFGCEAPRTLILAEKR